MTELAAPYLSDQALPSTPTLSEQQTLRELGTVVLATLMNMLK